MTNKKFIGGGFPGIRECIDEKNDMTKESIQKREFSVRNLIPINMILTKSKSQINTNFKLSEEFNVKDNIKYNTISEEFNKNYTNNKFSSNDLLMINGPINKSIENIKKVLKKKVSKKKVPKKKVSKKKVSKKKVSKKK
jgi:hypothetical protein